MTEKKHRAESEDKGVESDAASASPMHRFKSLARKLVKVPRNRIDAERERDAKRKREGRGTD